MQDFSQLRLDTPRLQLRPLRADDADALFAIFSDVEVTRYWSHAPWTARQQAVDLIARVTREAANGEALRLGLARRTDDHLLGTVSLFHFNTGCRRAEIGYGLAREAWGQGWMQEALEALVGWAFGPLGLHRLEADIDPRNAGSARSLLRLGFRLEGTLRERWIVDGQVSDSGLYGLLAQEWAASVG